MNISIDRAVARGIGDRYRLRFCYNGLDYSLSITDPEFEERYGSYLYSHEYVHFNHPVACVSLTREFNRAHFKVVAALIER